MKAKTVYTCQSCAAQFPKWMGKCSECNQWNSLVEETYTDTKVSEKDAKGLAAFHSEIKSAIQEDSAGEVEHRPYRLDEIKEQDSPRVKTSYQEFNRVLGGGIVPGSLILIGGDPGIGKSTIVMQAIADLATSDDYKVLYVTGEESARQVKLRAARLGVDSPHLLVFAENNLDDILKAVRKLKPKVLVIDSIQTIFTANVQSAPGSVSQIRECTAKLMTVAKSYGIATFIVGHVTKEGAIAGPKVLEHMVDTVLYFDGSGHHTYRILRAVKNRFGSTNEIGVFEMQSEGLREVTNPSEMFLMERPVNCSGSVVVCTVEGSRPILVEIQALVSQSALGMPRRTSIGFDHNKLSMIVAVLEKKLGMPFYGHDIFVNVVGGIELDEPAGDLGVALALVSSFKNQALSQGLMVCGEVGLAGEVRKVSTTEQRLLEAERLGFSEVMIPKNSKIKIDKSKLKIHEVSDLADAVRIVFSAQSQTKASQSVRSASTQFERDISI